MHSDNHLDDTDRKLLNLVQLEFPLTAEPYVGLGVLLGIGGEEVIRHIEQLKTAGIIRQIGPVIDARSLGYRTTLVAMRVPENRLDKAAEVIVEHPGVSHAYERDHHFNFWFTLAIPPATDPEVELKRLTGPVGAEAVFALPALKLFKLRAYFAMGDEGQSTAETEAPPGDVLRPGVEVSWLDRLVINELQQDLPLVSQPFTVISDRLGMSVDNLLARCRWLKQYGVIRRFGAAINHKRAGFEANAMTCWVAPPNKVDAVGHKLAALREVSHCYERKTNPLWQYNLFAMVHEHSREMCQQLADRVSAETGLGDSIMLFSTKEFKKVRVKYQV
ncbi:MAG: Lrp/AsnC family transcriptional regulator [Chloroflexi bacterium]|nr:Lrp/AsnC family transcriptional regulator [Chloroflexota bacterium]